MQFILLLGFTVTLILTSCSKQQSAAQAILSKAENNYAQISLVSFTGVSTSEVVINNATTQINTQLSMNFQREKQSDLEWQSTQSSFSGSILQTNHLTYITVGLKKTKQVTSFVEALEAASGISGELTCFIPELLLKTTNRLNFVSLTQLPDIQVDGVLCYCIAGNNAKGSYIELVIDKTNFMIKQVNEHFSVDGKATGNQLLNSQPDKDLSDVQMKRTQTFVYHDIVK